jgi:hypothetical protein
MRSLRHSRSIEAISRVVLVCFVGFQITCFLPVGVQAGAAADDLKKIEYKYYFRGKYATAIEQLRAFLKRSDSSSAEIIEAREYLAASLILSGAAEEGKDQYLKLLESDHAYGGPDPSVFKPVIVAAFDEAKAEYASIVIRSVPEQVTAGDAVARTEPEAEQGKPIYKKWWFYATMAAVLVVVAGAAGSGGEDAAASERDKGTVTIEVDMP